MPGFHHYVAKHFLAPLQLGVSIKGGCEAIIHSVNQIMSSAPPDRHWTLLVDFENAFNSINRESTLLELRQHLPSLSAWMEACYYTQSLSISVLM